jgi:mRNA (guanine-N7-)-methyltransferase
MEQKVASFYDGKQKQSQRERNDSPLFAIRSFNNFIKSVLIAETVKSAAIAIKSGKEESLHLLDLAGGTGGDLSKYQHSPQVRQVVLVDISSDSVAEAKRRYGELIKRSPKLYRAQFFQGNAFSFADMEKLCPVGGTFDIVSCQFAFHYACATIESLSEALSIVSFNLRPGGVFVATFPNATFILNNLDNKRQLITHDYSIRFTGDSEYLFSMGEAVVDVAEFLVHRSTLEEIAGKFGLRVKQWTPFQDFFRNSIKDRGHFLLAEKMGCDDTGNAFQAAALYVVVTLEKE